ncbi:transcription repressor NadR [Clostridium polynesiense]|uniref:transcription repressor NadR n=1 Tax=Clostridium polynesiense TaxID=1325933 RepID=UPI0005912470|nr:transcription repressor NadR [Clostridium polynesiense]
MNSIERRNEIFKMLLNSVKPLKGIDLANKLGVTRQVIVRDIAILRAEGRAIIATPEGYIIYNAGDIKITRIIAVNHNKDELYDEMSTIIKYGGRIEDVIVEHPLYGEIKSNLLIKNAADLEAFMKSFNGLKAEPLSTLTAGLHLHTISADDEETLDRIVEELKNKNYIIVD